MTDSVILPNPGLPGDNPTQLSYELLKASGLTARSYRNARFRGGWGPAHDGTHLVQQFGVLPTQRDRSRWPLLGRQVRQLQRTLDELTDWLNTHLDSLQCGRCPPQ